METVESDIITMIVILLSCCSMLIVLGAITTLAWLKEQRDWHKSNPVKPENSPPQPPEKDVKE